ncbi:branched-chain amino acid transporter permease [Campylobacter concisus]|uniref:branched-chain amino acid transporter permease n=1 Tax=Campylobacter concisus TaxID=199 RepID=UPI000CD973BF|nr:AzlD domain-containing protein [Campylobacter concisus]
MISVSSSEMVLFVAVLLSAIATFITRATPFYILKNYKPNPYLDAIEKHMGMMIMVVLVCYGLKDTKFSEFPYGLSEIVAVFTAILMHLKFKNTLLSIVISTGIYMFLIRIF